MGRLGLDLKNQIRHKRTFFKENEVEGPKGANENWQRR